MTDNEKLTKKLFEIQSLHLKFTKTAQGYNYKYVPLDELWDKLLPELEKRQLLVVHRTLNKEVMTEIFDVETGENRYSAIPLPENLDPQKLGSAITYFRRYNLVQLFNLMTESDDDAQSTVPKKAPLAKPLPLSEIDPDLGF